MTLPAKSTRSATRFLTEAYDRMHSRFGAQNWWPAESAFEVCVGAILTQNTSWSNVERAIRALKAAGVLAPVALHRLANSELEGLLRSAGTFRVKARRLRAFLDVLVNQHGGHLLGLFSGETDAVRRRLLDIPGIGPETADCLLLYASTHESFVVDAYTRRIFVRHGWADPQARYADLQQRCEEGFVPGPGQSRLGHWREAHAQLVMVGKHYCRSRAPKCQHCPLQPLLPAALPLPS